MNFRTIKVEVIPGDDFRGWIAPDGCLWSSTQYTWTHETLASLILEELYLEYFVLKHPYRLMCLNKRMIDLGWIRYDYECVWHPAQLTTYQRTALEQLDREYGHVDRERFYKVYVRWKRNYPELKGE